MTGLLLPPTETGRPYTSKPIQTTRHLVIASLAALATGFGAVAIFTGSAFYAFLSGVESVLVLVFSFALVD